MTGQDYGHPGKTRRNRRAFTPEEDAVILRVYPTSGAAATLAAMPRREKGGARNIRSIRSRALVLGVTTRARWTPEERARRLSTQKRRWEAQA